MPPQAPPVRILHTLPPSPPSRFMDKARPLFEGCTPRAAGRGWTYACGEVESWILDMGGLTPPEALRLSLKALHSMVQDASPEPRSEVTLAGRAWPSARFFVCAEARSEGCQGGLMVTVGAVDGGTRLLGCSVRGGGWAATQRCQAMLEFLAGEGTPDGATLLPVDNGLLLLK